MKRSIFAQLRDNITKKGVLIVLLYQLSVIMLTLGFIIGRLTYAK